MRLPSSAPFGGWGEADVRPRDICPIQDILSLKQRNEALTLAHAQTIHYTSN